MASAPARGALIVAAGLLLSLAIAILAQRVLVVSPHATGAMLLFAVSGVVFLGSLELDRRRKNSRAVTRLDDRDLAGVVPQPPVMPESRVPRTDLLLRLGVIAALAFGAWLTFDSNKFTLTNVALWLAAIGIFLATFAERPTDAGRGLVRALARRDKWTLRLSSTWLVVALIVLVAIFFRFWHLDQTPSEMVGDHAEKLLDVNDVLNGQLRVFFPRNTGREAFQFYLAALTVKVFDIPLGRLSLQLGTAAFGVFAIPWIYLLGKELFTRNVGLIAAALAAISLWHTAISRFGLRYPLTAAFAAPALLFLVRAFKHNRRNDWLLAGFFVGFGLHTYVPFRAVPALFIGLVLLKAGLDLARRYIPAAHRGASGEATALTRGFWINACLGGVLAALVFLPLARYATDYPNWFWYRALTRSTGIERPIQGNPILTFIDNQKNALLGFNYRGDSTWVTHISYDPMLDVISAALFFLGMLYVLWRLVRVRDRAAAYLLVMLFGLMLPSTANLAFPFENPSGARAGGAIIPVAILAALPLALAASRVHRGLEHVPIPRQYPGILVAGATIVLLLFAARLNYNWYFDEYDARYRWRMGNASEMGAVARDFATSIGTLRHVYVMSFPDWVDARLIGVEAGDVTWNNSIGAGVLSGMASGREAKLFLVNQADATAIQELQRTFPHGSARRYASRVPNADFIIYHVPEAAAP